MTDEQIEQEAAVTHADVVKLLGALEPGSVHSAANLYARFIRNLEGTHRPVPHQTALGHALRAAGCEGKRIRKSRKIPGTKRREYSEVACWVIPGVPVAVRADPIGELTRSMAGTAQTENEVWRQYKNMYWNRGWGDAPLARRTLLIQLTACGHPPVKVDGKVVRQF
jgi:hypothetical protein